jgi:ZIP family zinc transporter
MGEALIWGAVAASSLVIGAVLGLARDWAPRSIGLVLAFGAGALISAVSFELAEEGVAVGEEWSVGLGLAAGALTYFLASKAIARRAPGAGTGLVLGAFLDGIPEQLVLGIGIAIGDGVSVALLVAIFMSNLPEAIGASSDMHEAGRSNATIMRVWLAVAVICTAATVIGFALADSVSGDVQGAINGFAAGALLVMLIDSMIPEATKKAGAYAGLLTVLGFALAASL